MKPVEVDDKDVQFGKIDGLMPSDEELLAAPTGGLGEKLFSDWFFSGLTSLDLKPRDGVDGDKAKRHIRAIMLSWAPKHEHKTAACAYLFEHWFDLESSSWEAKPLRRA